ncbi:MAG: hypothetical protein IKH73_09920, partial [Erysipelotrichaceae bacterium]|nr:hypothetical protein [Erysipelotrichaceae bacterium]
MNRTAFATRIYLDENVKEPFGFSRAGWNFLTMENLTKDDFYDYFTMTGWLLDLDGRYVFWIGSDIAGVSPLLYDRVYARLKKICPSLEEDCLIMNGTHTHSGPSVTKGHFRGNDLIPADCIYDSFIDHMAEVAADIFNECLNNLKPYTAQIAYVPIEGCYGNRNSLDLPS